MKVNQRIETIFSHAIAMDNRGLKNSIHCVGSFVFLVNFDHSMILRFPLRKSETVFESPISFNASDYDSDMLHEEAGKIVFRTETANYEKRKICGSSDYSPGKIRKLFHQYWRKGETSKLFFHLSNECIPLFDERLSHTELSVEESKLVLRQRNIYSGTILEVSPKPSKGLIKSLDKLPTSFGPVGMKTKDFLCLFMFHNVLKFIPAEDFLLVMDVKNDFDGILSFCRYDEIINLYKEE